MEELTITVQIAERPYRLKVKIQEEEVIRNAARDINELIKSYGDNYAFKDKQDLLAMAALHFGTLALKKNFEAGHTDNEIITQLESLNAYLSENMI
jgi:cell division protein ZapA